MSDGLTEYELDRMYFMPASEAVRQLIAEIRRLRFKLAEANKEIDRLKSLQNGDAGTDFASSAS